MPTLLQCGPPRRKGPASLWGVDNCLPAVYGVGMNDAIAYGQRSFDGQSKGEIAVARVQEVQRLGLLKGQPLKVGISGGKDSVVLADICEQSGIPIDLVHNLTTCDPPEIVRFVQSMPGVRIARPRKSIWQLIYSNGLPTRQHRWCCRELKKKGGEGIITATGVRWAESNNRKDRRVLEPCFEVGGRGYVNPLVDWTDDDIWEYIEARGLATCSLYKEGFERIGCVLCPSSRAVARDMERWPKIADAWRRAAYRYWDKGTKSARRFPSREAFFLWWLDRDASAPDAGQATMFDQGLTTPT